MAEARRQFPGSSGPRPRLRGWRGPGEVVVDLSAIESPAINDQAARDEAASQIKSELVAVSARLKSQAKRAKRDSTAPATKQEEAEGTIEGNRQFDRRVSSAREERDRQTTDTQVSASIGAVIGGFGMLLLFGMFLADNPPTLIIAVLGAATIGAVAGGASGSLDTWSERDGTDGYKSKIPDESERGEFIDRAQRELVEARQKQAAANRDQLRKQRELADHMATNFKVVAILPDQRILAIYYLTLNHFAPDPTGGLTSRRRAILVDEPAHFMPDFKHVWICDLDDRPPLEEQVSRLTELGEAGDWQAMGIPTT